MQGQTADRAAFPIGSLIARKDGEGIRDASKRWLHALNARNVFALDMPNTLSPSIVTISARVAAASISAHHHPEHYTHLLAGLSRLSGLHSSTGSSQPQAMGQPLRGAKAEWCTLPARKPAGTQLFLLTLDWRGWQALEPIRNKASNLPDTPNQLFLLW